MSNQKPVVSDQPATFTPKALQAEIENQARKSAFENALQAAVKVVESMVQGHASLDVDEVSNCTLKLFTSLRRGLEPQVKELLEKQYAPLLEEPSKIVKP